MSAPQPPSDSDPNTAARAPLAAPVMATYARRDLTFERGEGAWLITPSGERYLDCGSGIAVNALGHAEPRLVSVLKTQAERLWHTSNLYRIEAQEKLAERLVGATFADTVFFCNSGAEACEGAIKTARSYHHASGQPERWRTITFEGAFHGRTLAMLAAAGNPKHTQGFGPEIDGFDHVAFGDLAAVEAAIRSETAAIMIEPIQGEAGIRVAPLAFLEDLRTLCDRHGLMLIFDEVQSGMGRTGKLFAHQWGSITPDIMAVAKGLGGGFPIGAVLATAKAAKGMTAGMHGSTFGGNPLATAIGVAVLDIMLEPDFFTSLQIKGLRLKQQLAELKDSHPDSIEDVRGVGFLMGLKLKVPVADVLAAAEDEHLLLVGAGDNVVRILPPLTILQEDLAEAVARLDRAMAHLKS